MDNFRFDTGQILSFLCNHIPIATIQFKTYRIALIFCQIDFQYLDIYSNILRLININSHISSIEILCNVIDTIFSTEFPFLYYFCLNSFISFCCSLPLLFYWAFAYPTDNRIQNNVTFIHNRNINWKCCECKMRLEWISDLSMGKMRANRKAISNDTPKIFRKK